MTVSTVVASLLPIMGMHLDRRRGDAAACDPGLGRHGQLAGSCAAGHSSHLLLAQGAGAPSGGGGKKPSRGDYSKPNRSLGRPVNPVNYRMKRKGGMPDEPIDDQCDSSVGCCSWTDLWAWRGVRS